MQEPALAHPTKRLQAAEQAFMQARFGAAARAFRGLLDHPTTAATAHLRLGQVALLANRPASAERHLAAAAQLQPSPAVYRQAAALFRRTARYEAAAACFATLGDEAATIACRHLAGRQPLWRVEAPAGVCLPFVTGRPVVPVTVNGREALFLVDTGAEEVVVDEGLAQELDLTVRGRQWAVFAGDRRGQVGYAVVERLGLGDGAVSGLPVQTQPLRRLFQAAFAPLTVEGIIGTSLLARFRPCLDFRRNQLRLDPPGSPFEPGPAAVRFWLAEAFLPLVTLTVEDEKPLLALLDSGQERFALALDAEAAAALGTGDGATETGIGGGGAVQVQQAAIGELAFGGHRFRNPSAIAFAGFPLAYRFGFRVDGAVGWELLRRHALSLDFNRMRLSVVA